MKHTATVLLLTFFCCASVVLYAEKNIFNVPWMTPPALSNTLMSDPAMKWNFNFRPYGSDSAAMLWTDPAMQRDVSEGKLTAGARPTALSVTCDETGFALYVFAGEPDIAQALETGKDFPGSTLECYVSPRDADNEKIEHYYQFIIDQKTNTIRDFPWFVNDQNFTAMNGKFLPETRNLPNGYITKLYFPWHYFWNRLPFLTQHNNVWRIGVMRWCPGGGQTWGGTVHKLSRMGYVCWPEFTPERRTAIMQQILRYAWIRFNVLKTDYAPANFPEDTSPYRKEIPQDLRSNNFIPEYQDFNRDVLNAMVAEREALGKEIGNFGKLTLAEQEAFYRENVGKLIHFDYDVQLAFDRWLTDKLIAGETVK